MSEKTVQVDNKPVDVSENATVQEAIEKAKLPKNVKVYDVETGELLNPKDPMPEKIGTIQPFTQG